MISKKKTQSASIHVSTRVDKSELVLSPEQILQRISLKIFQRRQSFLDELVDKRVSYDSGSGMRSGIVERVDDTHAHLRESRGKTKVALRKLCFEDLK